MRCQMMIMTFLCFLFLKEAQGSILQDEREASSAALAHKIITLTQAERDTRLEVYYQLSQTLLPHIQGDGSLEGQWNGLWKDCALEPEKLVLKQSLKEKIRNKEALSPTNEAFIKINKTLKVIEILAFNLQSKPLPSTVLTLFLNLKDFYQVFMQKCMTTAQVIMADNSRTEELEELLEPKALMMGEWWPHQFHRISQKMARYLLQLDEHGEILQKAQGESISNHRVSFLPQDQKAEVYFKVNGMPALNPSREYMLSSLYQKLGIQVPATGLLILDHVKIGENYTPDIFILQTSQAIQGLSGKKVLKEEMALSLDLEHFSRQVIGTLLSGPVDGKADNYIVASLGDNKHGWVSIDNDEVFQAPLRKDETVHLKSTLLLLSEMDQRLAPTYCHFLTTLVPDLLLLEGIVKLTFVKFSDRIFYNCNKNELFDVFNKSA